MDYSSGAPPGVLRFTNITDRIPKGTNPKSYSPCSTGGKLNEPPYDPYDSIYKGRSDVPLPKGTNLKPYSGCSTRGKVNKPPYNPYDSMYKGRSDVPLPKGTNPKSHSPFSTGGKVNEPPYKRPKPNFFIFNVRELPKPYDSVTKGRSDYRLPKDEDDKALAKLKDSITKVASLTNREIFDMWCTVWGISYISKEEEDYRFLIFEKAIVDEPTTPNDVNFNFPAFADRTKEEFYKRFSNRSYHACIFKSKINGEWVWLAELRRGDSRVKTLTLNGPPNSQLMDYSSGAPALPFDVPKGSNLKSYSGCSTGGKVNEPPDDPYDSIYKGRSNVGLPKDEDDKALAKLKDSITKVASLTNREIFDMWCTVWRISYISKEEEDSRFLIFEKAIVDEPTTPKEVNFNYPAFADRTKEEFNKSFPNRYGPQLYNACIFKSKINEDWVRLAELTRRDSRVKTHNSQLMDYSSGAPPGALRFTGITDRIPKGTNPKSYSRCSTGGKVNEPPYKRPNPYDSIYEGRSDVRLPKDEDDKALAKLKDSITKVASLTNREIFDMWRTVWRISYISKEEEDYRFLIFEKAIVDEPTTPNEVNFNFPAYADRTKEEFYKRFPNRSFHACIFKSKINEDWVWLAEHRRRGSRVNC